MFDIAPSEMLVVALVAIVFIGPKDLPRVMRVVGQWVGRGRSMARHFRSAVDEMIRETELAEMEQKWKAENERIMREHATLIESVASPIGALSVPEEVSDEPGPTPLRLDPPITIAVPEPVAEQTPAPKPQA